MPVLIVAVAVAVSALLTCGRTRRAITTVVTLLFVVGVLLVIAVLIAMELHYGCYSYRLPRKYRYRPRGGISSRGRRNQGGGP